MKKVLIFPYSNQLGTTIPSITLANLLKENGYSVEFASRGKYTFVIEEKGFKVHDVPEISYMHYREYLDKNRMDYHNEHLIRTFVDYEVGLIEELDPDVVVGHNRPSLYISTQLTKKKYVNLTVASLIHEYDQPFYLPENHALNRYVPFMDVNNILPNKLVTMVYNLTMKQFAEGFNKVLREYGLSKVKSFLDLNIADIVLLVETYGLVKLKKLPNNYFFLEQDTSSGFGGIPSWMDEVREAKKEGKKIIGINMGTSSFEAYPLVLDYLIKFVTENDDYMLISNHCGLEHKYENEKSIFVEEFIKPKIMLELADVVITHGGKNTTNEAILAKKPIIGIPEQAEQLWNLKYIESKGFARVVSRFKLKRDCSILIKEIKLLTKNEKFQKKLDNFVQEDLINSDVVAHRESILEAFKDLVV